MGARHLVGACFLVRLRQRVSENPGRGGRVVRRESLLSLGLALEAGLEWAPC